MEAKIVITIREATKEKTDLTENNMELLLDAKEGTSTILGLKVKRLKNTFIIF